MSKPLALLVDDDIDFRNALEALVAREGFQTYGVGSLEEAREAMEQQVPDLALVDMELPDGLGVELLAEDPPFSETEYVIVTGHASVETAVQAMRDGALDYLTKPFEPTRLASVINNVARTRALKQELSSLRNELRRLGRFGRFVGRSRSMQEVYTLIARVAPTSASVLIVGESGTGKELAAQTVHSLSRRKDAPFVAINCGAVAPNLIESELFGHEKGSFTGAERRHEGYFEQAAGGTLFLDEITEMPQELQVKLLRVLETGRFHRVGGREAISSDVRVVAATNRDPAEAVKEELLREDLYYRLAVFPIVLPPLRDRGDDIDLLAQHFLEEFNEKEGVEKRLTPSALLALRKRPWPGNVREFRNAVQRAFILADEEIGGEALLAGEPMIDESAPSRGDGAAQDGRATVSVPVGTEIASMEKSLILATLDQLDGDKKKAAEVLGISLKTLYNRLSVYRAEDRTTH